MAMIQWDGDIRDEHLAALGPQLGPVFHELYSEVVWMHAKWLEFQKLFAHSPERVELLNETASYFFGVVQEVLWENVLLHMTRLTDPAKQGRFDNLTLSRLPDLIPDPTLASEVSKLIETSRSRTRFAREWRNKRLAHTDLDIASNHVQPLPGFSRKDVEHALASIADVLNRLADHYLKTEIAFGVFKSLDDGESLVRWLAQAVRDREHGRC